MLQGEYIACVLAVILVVLLGIAESSTINVTSDLVPLSAHVREQVHNWRYSGDGGGCGGGSYRFLNAPIFLIIN